MRREREDQPDPSQPSLLVTYGNTTRKVRPLDRELLVLGRASTCDINLVSPEVANIHALIVHAAEGWRVRDCGSRMGTRLNGKAVQESPLGDGDVLQIGSFSFHLNLPGGYEMELRRFRVEVERDRKGLEEERDVLRRHQVEIEEELREAELHMAERAQMARDRSELQRLREEIQRERERIERVGALHERLPPLHRFRAELTDNKPADTAQ